MIFMDPEFVDNTIKMLKRAPSEKAQKSNSESVRQAVICTAGFFKILKEWDAKAATMDVQPASEKGAKK